MLKSQQKKKMMSRTLMTLAAVLIFVGCFWAAEATMTLELPIAGEPPRLYSSQCHDDLTRTFTKAIGESKESVLMIIYALNDPSIIAALRDKADKGVPVKVICDEEANPKLKQKLGSKIALVPINEKGLMHQKIVVIDSKQVWIGTANMTHYSLRIHGNLVVGADAPALAEYIQSYAVDVLEKGSRKSTEYKTFDIGGQKVEMWFLPDNKEAIERIIGLIDGAKKTIKVAMFTWTRYDFAQAMIRARLRGITVDTALDNNSSKGASAKIAHMLLNKGIPIIINSNEGLLHYKTMIIDNETLVNGSANWTKAAFTQNRDCFMILLNLTDPQQKKLETLWKAIIAESKPLPPRSRSR